MKKKNYLLSWLKAIGISMANTVVIIAISAVAVKNIDASTKLLNTIMLLCKIISISAGSFVLIKSIRKKGLVFGGLFGAIYWAICFLVSIASTTFNNTFPVFDIAFSVAIGAISGILWANLFSEK